MRRPLPQAVRRDLVVGDKPVSANRTAWIVGLAIGAAALGGGLWYYEQKKGVVVTATTGTMNVSVPTGQTLTVNLPTGGQWVGQLTFTGTGTLTGGLGTAPLVISNLQSGGSVALAWTSGGTPQASVLTVTTS